MTQLVLFNVFNGLIVGAFYALMALGLSLILNLSGVINFAHGGFLAIGGYLAYMLIPYVGFWGALIVSPLLTAILGLIVERLLIRRVYGRDPLYSLLLTFGLAFMLRGRNAVHLGGAKPALSSARLAGDAAEQRLFLPHRLSAVHGARCRGRGDRIVPYPHPHPARHAHPRRDARPRDRIGTWRQRSYPAKSQFRSGRLSRRPCGRFGGRPAWATADHWFVADYAELRRHHCRRPRQLARHPAWWIADRCGLRGHLRVLSLRH